MAEKIGELLLRSKLITGTQLEEALHNQAIFGGRLGTYFIENGVIREEQLARVLSRKLSVPFVRAERFENIPTEIIGMVPVELAEKHGAIPIGLDKRRLVLAMMNPGDCRAIDEICFATGRAIRPVVAPEAVIVHNLQKYYQVEPEARYIEVTSEPRPEVKPSPAQETGEGEGKWLGGDEQEAILEAWEQERYGNASARRVTEEPAGAAPGPFGDQAGAVPGLAQVCLQMSELRNRESLADLVASYLSRRIANGAIFLLRNDHARGWRAVIDRQKVPGFDKLRISLEPPSLLRTVAETCSAYLGPVPPDPRNRMILREFGGEHHEAVLLVPVLHGGKPIGILYAENREPLLHAEVPDLEKLAAKMTMAFEVLSLTNRIASI